jgi:hypothetical protein
MRAALGPSMIAVVLAAAVLLPRPAAAQEHYEPVPPGYDFPADEATLLRFRDTENVPEMRRHSWYVFAGMTKPAKGGEAIWETWFPVGATFSAGPETRAFTGPLRRSFDAPRQFRMRGGAQPQAAGESELAGVMFNKEAHDFIRSNGLHLKSKLDQLNNGFPAGTPLEKREIAPFPRTAISLKLVWRLVRQNSLTVVPVWDNRPTRPDSQGNPPSTWARAVVVDPSRENIPANETREISWQNMPLKARVVPVSRFYHFRISDAEIAAIRQVVGAANADVGDYAIFVAMHYTTKEIPEWIWSTFWWHDEPDVGPFGSDRPTVVGGVWRNYLMETGLSMDVPREYDGTPNSIFNPYLEARFIGGLGSNCMTCHRQARWTADGDPGFTVTRGTPRPDDPMFQNALKLDFLWSITRAGDNP